MDKGERLANLIRHERTLLVLDGVEPLQSAHAHERGKLKDPALLVLLEALARDNPGLCLISTRERLTDLDALAGSRRFSAASSSDRVSVQQIDLEKLSPASARALLRAGGVRGSDAELEAGAATFGCHALALNLLVEYLRDIPGHAIAEAAKIPALDLPPDQQKDEAPRRMIDTLARKLDTGPELNVLRMLGLFDRPADKDSLDALRAEPVIVGLTDHLGITQEANWLRAVQRLRQYKLLAEMSHHAPDELDAHPLVREHFADQLQRTLLTAWKKGNLRLDEHLTHSTKEFPDTVEEMAPLFAAVAHGCAAGRQQQAYDEVYQRRIRRGNEHFQIKKLGAFGADLAALSGFFVIPWRVSSAALTEAGQAWLLNAAGVRLRALGRLQEAVQPMQASLDVDIVRTDWEGAAISAGNLSGLTLTLGDLPQALAAAQQSVELADRSGDSFWRKVNRTTLADALHQAGHLTEAAAEFHAAETDQPHGTRLLYSVQGFQYCDLLLSHGQFQEVNTRAAKMLKDGESIDSLLDITL